MTNEYELADSDRGRLIFEKEQLLAPLRQGMLAPPHPMPAGADDQSYYRGEVAKATPDQQAWVDQRAAGQTARESAAAGEITR
jgi:NADH-quinone oxidoreductase subunit I